MFPSARLLITGSPTKLSIMKGLKDRYSTKKVYLFKSKNQTILSPASIKPTKDYFFIFPVTIGLNAAPSPLAISAQIILVDLSLNPRKRS